MNKNYDNLDQNIIRMSVAPIILPATGVVLHKDFKLINMKQGISNNIYNSAWNIPHCLQICQSRRIILAKLVITLV
jgi:hypothetical protein